MKKILYKLIILIAVSTIIMSYSACGPVSEEENPSLPAESYYQNTFKIYVAPNGDDSYDGLAEDSPVKSLNKAVQIATLLQDQVADDYDALEIHLFSGRHQLDETVVINGKATAKLPLFFKGEKDTVISGGQSFKGGWQLEDEAKNLYKRSVSQASFRQLYADGERMIRGRYPDAGNEFKIRWYGSTGAAQSSRFMGFNSALLTPDVFPSNPAGVEVIFVQEWAMSVGVITAKKTEDGYTKFSINTETSDLVWGRDAPGRVTDRDPAWFENALEFVDSENEWFLDDDGTLFYIPPANRDINDIEFTLPKLEKLVLIEGNSIRRVSGVVFEDIIFSDSNWTKPDDGYCEIQATNYLVPGGWKHPESAIEGRFADNIVFSRCVIKNTGAAAVDLRKGVNGVMIKNSVFRDIAGTGLSMGYFGEMMSEDGFNPSYVLTDKANCTQGVTVENCYFTRIGLDLQGGSAIAGGYVKDITIRNNEIHDVRYSGIALGWGWQAQQQLMGNFQITGNRIYDTVNGLTFDGSEIYLMGMHDETQAKSIISGNYITCGGGLGGIYFDEGTNYYQAVNNVIEGTGEYPNRSVAINFHDVNCMLKNIDVKSTYTTVANDFDWQAKMGGVYYHTYMSSGAQPVSQPAARGITVEQFIVQQGSWSKEAADIIESAGIENKYAEIKEW